MISGLLAKPRQRFKTLSKNRFADCTDRGTTAAVGGLRSLPICRACDAHALRADLHHIGGEDRGEAAGLAHAGSPSASSRPDKISSRCSAFPRGVFGTTTGVMARS